MSGDVNADSMDTFDDSFNDAMRCIGYDTPCQILGDDFEEVLDGSQDRCLQDVTIEVEVETCKEIDTARASISSDEELVEVHGSCMSDAELCEEDSTHKSDLVVESSDSVSYLSAVSETESLHRSQGLQRHHVSCHLKVRDSNISLALEHYDVIRQMLATYGWGAPMFDEHGDSTLSLAKVHVFQEVVKILNHNYYHLVSDSDYLM